MQSTNIPDITFVILSYLKPPPTIRKCNKYRTLPKIKRPKCKRQSLLLSSFV